MRFILLLLFFFTFLFSQDLDKIKLHLKWKHQFQFAGFYMAKEKGFYKDLGLDVAIREASFNQDTTHIVLKDINSFAISDSALIYEKMIGEKVKILGAVFQHSPLIFLYLNKSGIKTPKDFKNKKLMLDLNIKENVLVKALIKEHNINDEDLNYIETSYNIDDLINGKVDIFTAYSSNEIFTLNQKGIDFGFIEPRDYGLDFYGDIVFTSEENFQKNPKRVEDFYKASMKGWIYAFNNIDETIKLILEKYNTQNSSYEKLLFEAVKLKNLSGIEDETFGKIKLSRVNKILSTYFLSESNADKGNVDDLNIFSIIDDIESEKVHLTKKEKVYLNQKKFITYCSRNRFYPYSTFTDGEYKGISQDYIKELEKKLDIRFKAKITSRWTECYNLIKNNESDMVSFILQEPNDYKYLTPTKEYIKSYYVLATNINEPFVADIKDLKAQVIGVSKETSNVKKLIETKYPHINIRVVDGIKEGLKLISKGSIYGLIGPSDTVAHSIQEKYPFEIKIMNRLDNNLYPGSFGVKKGDELLFSILNKTISSIDEKKNNEIRSNWVSVRQEARVDYSLVWQVLIAFFILFIAFVYKQYLLKKSNMELEKVVKEEVEKNREKDKILFQQSKLVSMGEMLNNIAHQWRQPLNAINSSVAVIDALMMKKEIQDNSLEKNLSEIESQTRYMSDTIESFRMFFNPIKNKQDFLLSDAINDVLRIVKFDYEKNGIKIKVFNQNDITVSGYLGEYIQIIISILNNSKDAFISNKIENPIISIYIDEQVIIDDNAGGINNDIIDRVFEPYFTTKHKEKGTGTGLYMAKMIVEHSMDGSLTLQQIKNGTRFKIII